MGASAMEWIDRLIRLGTVALGPWLTFDPLLTVLLALWVRLRALESAITVEQRFILAGVLTVTFVSVAIGMLALLFCWTVDRYAAAKGRTRDQ